uniref:Uncharacterized protein n=1 Tax=Cacopsylla melanoneura TaxID=428564 RepID=A0A8D9B614_9HEMI
MTLQPVYRDKARTHSLLVVRIFRVKAGLFNHVNKNSAFVAFEKTALNRVPDCSTDDVTLVFTGEPSAGTKVVVEHSVTKMLDSHFTKLMCRVLAIGGHNDRPFVRVHLSLSIFGDQFPNIRPFIHLCHCLW